MVGVIEIATATATALAPYLPKLLKGAEVVGEKFAEGIASKAGELTIGKVTEIWSKLKSRFVKQPALENAASLVASQPDDKTYQTVFAKTLATYLQQDPDFSKELAGLLGGEKGVQQVLADKGSLIEDVTQEMEGSGSQSVSATDSVIRGVRQIQRK